MLQKNLNKNPFDVPDKYFEVLPMTIQERCMAVSKKKQTSASRSNWVLGASLGALALGLVSIFSILTENTQLPSTEEGRANLDFYPPSVTNNSWMPHEDQLTFSNNNILNVNNSTGYQDRSEMMINQLAVENFSIDDILIAGY